MGNKFIVTAYGKDRPGIVADVTHILYEYGCNLEDTRMANLSGDFSLLILFASPDENDIEAKLTKAFARIESDKGISATIRAVSATGDIPIASHTTHTIKVEGLDHTGIVYRLSRYLADQGVNISNLDSSLSFTPESGSRIYRMEVIVEVQEGTAIDGIQAGLARLSEDLHVEISMD